MVYVGYQPFSGQKKLSANVSDIDGSSDDGSEVPLSKKGKKKKRKSNVVTLKARQDT